MMEDYQIRFCSIFLEPGYIGTLLSFLLYVGKFDFKKRYNLILLVALVLTISLAGFVISAMGWVFIKLQEGKPIKRLFYILAVLGCIYWGGISYNGGRNVLNEKYCLDCNMMRIKVFLEIIEHPISLMHILNNILITDKSCLGLETKQYENQWRFCQRCKF